MVEHQKAEAVLKQAFPELGDAEIALLAATATFADFSAGAYICHEGDEGTTLYVLVEGEADILVHADEEEILVDTIAPPAYFGEMAFLGETTRTATIRTRTDCHVLVLDHEDFLPVAHENPDLLRRLLRQIIGHLRRNDEAVIRELNVKNEALRRAYADLAEQEEMRTKFIATLSHELRTPLTSVKGFLSLIQQGAITGDSLKAVLDSVARNVEYMVGLTNDLLILYEMHPSAPDFVYLNLTDVVIEALNAAKGAMNGLETAVTLDIAPDLPLICADKRGLVLALRALIENAFKFNPDKKPIHIKVWNLNETEVAIAVSDEGIGIPENARQKIFEPFYRVEKEGGQHLFPGLGVGLTIARFMVERHNGRIQVDSHPYSGSTFTIILPQNK